MKLFKLFLAPGLWFGLLGVADVIEITAWGSSGHPSSGLVIFVYVLLGAPLFGASGLFYVIFGNKQRVYAEKIACGANIILIAIGAFFWVSFLV